MIKETLISAALLTAVAAEAKDFSLQAPVKAATVYFDSAEVMREAKVYLPTTGTHSIRIENFSADGKQVDIEVEGAVLINRVNEKASKREELASDTEKALLAVQADLAVCKSNISFHEKLAEAVIKKLPENPDLAEQMNKLSVINEKIRDLRQLHLELEEKVKVLTNKLNDEKAQLPQSKDSLLLQVFAEEVGEARIKIRNRENASWSPSSQIELDSKKSAITIRSYADIIQESGEIWENAEVTLAVAPPSYKQAPAFVEKNLSFARDNMSFMALRAKGAAVESAAMMEDVVVEEEEEQEEVTENVMMAKAAAPRLQVNATGLDFTLQLPGTYTLKSGNSASLRYREEQIPTTELSSSIYEWTDEKKLDAILTAKWQMPENFAFLPGNCQIKRDGLTVANKYFPDLWAAGSKREISFGIDPAFSIEALIPSATSSKAGLIGKSRIVENKKIITVRANADVNRQLKLYGRIPTATVSEITVDAHFSVEPSEKNPENHRNFLLWNIPKLKIAEEWKLEFSYDIKYPADKRVNF
ncbi:MAG: DUF4139 domain-containing protein [Cardiobacteriaceae bacterium]|nr:DUF4139 domain-containing protein [Cardiobacteriaceae bacterium]